MKNLFAITKQDILDYRADRGNTRFSIDRNKMSAITIGKLTALDINNAWKKALQNHQL